MDSEPRHQVVHEDLLTLARKALASAEDGDAQRLEAASMRLFEAFVLHVGAERPALLDLPPAEARLLLRGQQRIIDLLVDLAISVEFGGECACDTLASELLARLTLQAEDERHRLLH